MMPCKLLIKLKSPGTYDGEKEEEDKFDGWWNFP